MMPLFAHTPRRATTISQIHTHSPISRSRSEAFLRLRPHTQRRLASQYTEFPLNTGAKIPALGFGTWQDANAQERAVLTALKTGYRHIDGARIYGTEPAVGRAMARSGVPRNEVFLVTKLWNNAHHPEDVEKQCDDSLEDLGTDYVNLYLMHWPSPFARGANLRPKDSNGKTMPGDTDYVDTWRAMERLVEKGKARAIGISNFSKAELERLVDSGTTVPAVHQIELHPSLQQTSFLPIHRKHNIHITQYSPFGNHNPIYSKGAQYPKLLEDPTLGSIAKRHSKTPAQVTLAWGIMQGHSVIPKSKTSERIAENWGAEGLELDQDDMESMRKLDKRLRFNDPSAGWGVWNFYEDLEGKT